MKRPATAQKADISGEDSVLKNKQCRIVSKPQFVQVFNAYDGLLVLENESLAFPTNCYNK